MSNSEQLCREYSLDEIKTATRDFDEELIIGKGGFGLVYMGSFNNDSCSASELAAVKRLSFGTSNQGETEFLREIETLSQLQHVHLVCLKGYCKQPPEMILVYDYMSNGTLADHLYKLQDNLESGLSWEERLNICIGAARGLDFLHREYAPGIIHRDIKDSNILLDDNFVAKIADFGLAKLVKTSTELHTTIVSSTVVKGTFGYLDPEYFYTQRLSKKTDVYAFGVVLLVVLCGRPAVDNKAIEEQRSLAEWAQKSIQKNRVDEIIDPHLAGKISSTSLKQFIKVSQKCLLRQSEQRPTMKEVVLGLESALKKQPTLYGTSSRRQNGRSSFTQMVTKLQTVLTKKQPAIAGKEKLDKLGLSDLDVRNLCPKFSLDEIKAATQNFSDKLMIGHDGFGVVYVGHLINGSKVAITKMGLYSDQNVREFCREIETLSKVQHDHVIQLKGYCHESSQMFLVYEYMSKGNLERHLCEHGGDQKALSWEKRLSICIGSARGLDFLHRIIEPGVIHRYVHCSKILLDDNFVPKISDFGLSKLDDGDGITGLAGTCGYIDPEYVMSGRVTTKSDVYSFGVVLLVVLSGTKAIDYQRAGEEYVLFWATQCIKENMIDEIIDPYLRGQIKSESLEQFLKISLQCLHKESKERPTMEEVVLGLELAMEFQLHSSSFSTSTQWIKIPELRLLLDNLDEPEYSPTGSDEAVYSPARSHKAENWIDFPC